ncbi:MAG: class I SAM-dependent methyltransferase [Chloroflexi bacterium]|nr:class I SAM-dependent methyltransferase [Chloroflexota bacterium]
MTRDRAALAQTFDRVADLYDRVRPGYPAALFRDLRELAPVPESGRIVEIGCGTGQATVALARWGCPLVCFEPGSNMAAVARRNLTRFPLVEVRTGRFEDAGPDVQDVDLVVAATSYHWLDPLTRVRRLAGVLRAGGSLAVFESTYVRAPDDRFYEAALPIYRRYTPEVAGLPPVAADLPTHVGAEIIRAGLFEEVAVRHYPWTATYDTARYLAVVSTYSQHLALPDDRRHAFLTEIGALIDEQFGGTLVEPRVSVLQVARRSGRPVDA